jgi:hypothetical protein
VTLVLSSLPHMPHLQLTMPSYHGMESTNQQ